MNDEQQLSTAPNAEDLKPSMQDILNELHNKYETQIRTLEDRLIKSIDDEHQYLNKLVDLKAELVMLRAKLEVIRDEPNLDDIRRELFPIIIKLEELI